MKGIKTMAEVAQMTDKQLEEFCSLGDCPKIKKRSDGRYELWSTLEPLGIAIYTHEELGTLLDMLFDLLGGGAPGEGITMLQSQLIEAVRECTDQAKQLVDTWATLNDLAQRAGELRAQANWWSPRGWACRYQADALDEAVIRFRAALDARDEVCDG